MRTTYRFVDIDGDEILPQAFSHWPWTDPIPVTVVAAQIQGDEMIITFRFDHDK